MFCRGVFTKVGIRYKMYNEKYFYQALFNFVSYKLLLVETISEYLNKCAGLYNLNITF